MGPAVLPSSCKHCGSCNGTAESKAVHSSRELKQVLLPDTLLNHTITLTLSSSKISEMKTGLCSGLCLLKGLL